MNSPDIIYSKSQSGMSIISIHHSSVRFIFFTQLVVLGGDCLKICAAALCLTLLLFPCLVGRFAIHVLAHFIFHTALNLGLGITFPGVGIS